MTTIQTDEITELKARHARELAELEARLAAGEQKPDGTTHVLMVTDMSGSMMALAKDVRGGFNSYLDGLKADGGEFRVTATLFDTKFIPLCVDAALADAPRLDETNYMPRGYTALLDAVGHTITGFESRVPELGDSRVILVIQTDGLENSSREYSYESVKKLLDERTKDGGKWAALYIGAGADTWDQASRMGVRADSYVHTSGSAAATDATYSSMTAATLAYAAGADAGEVSRTVRTATRGK